MFAGQRTKVDQVAAALAAAGVKAGAIHGDMDQASLCSLLFVSGPKRIGKISIFGLEKDWITKHGPGPGATWTRRAAGRGQGLPPGTVELDCLRFKLIIAFDLIWIRNCGSEKRIINR